MKLHYLYSDQRQCQCRAAVVTLNGEVIKDALYVDDEKQYVIQRTRNGANFSQKTVQGKVHISIPAIGKKPAYETPVKESSI